MEQMKQVTPGMPARQWRDDSSSPLEQALLREDERSRDDWLQAIPLLLLARAMQAESSACAWRPASSSVQLDTEPVARPTRPAAPPFEEAPPEVRGGDVRRTALHVLAGATVTSDTGTRRADHAPAAQAEAAPPPENRAREVKSGATPGVVASPAAAAGVPVGRVVTVRRHDGAHESVSAASALPRSGGKDQRRALLSNGDLRHAKREAPTHLAQQASAAAGSEAAAGATGWSYLFRSWKGRHSVAVTVMDQARDAAFSLNPGSDMAEQRLRRHGAGDEGPYRIVTGPDAYAGDQDQHHGKSS